MLEISKEDVNALPVRRYEGSIRLVDTNADLEQAMADILAEGVAGFDTETRPSFRVGESYPPSLAQFATAKAVYLFLLQKKDYSIELADILESPRVLKVGVSIADDIKSLKKVFPFEERAVLDVGNVAKRFGAKQTGVRNLVGMYLGFRVPKGAKTTNWARSQLSPQQIAYAATDAWACRELYLHFKSKGLV